MSILTVLKSWRDMFATARFVLQFVDRRYCIRQQVHPRTIMRTLSTSSSSSPFVRLASTAIYFKILKQMSCCWLISLKTFVIVASQVTDLIPHTIILYQVVHGTRCWNIYINFELLTDVDHVHWTWRSKSMFQQIRTSQQQVHAVVWYCTSKLSS